jgi:hypothetical protein
MSRMTMNWARQTTNKRAFVERGDFLIAVTVVSLR